MDCAVSGNMIRPTLVFMNALFPIAITEVSEILLSDVQPLNASLLINCKLLTPLNETVFNDVQFINAPYCIFVNVEGNTTSSRAVSPANAYAPISFTPSGIMTFVIVFSPI